MYRVTTFGSSLFCKERTTLTITNNTMTVRRSRKYFFLRSRREANFIFDKHRTYILFVGKKFLLKGYGRRFGSKSLRGIDLSAIGKLRKVKAYIHAGGKGDRIIEGINVLGEKRVHIGKEMVKIGGI